jgi:polysaccharide biosynthesis transport protein
MQKSQNNAAKSGFGVQDALFVLFKHKWMILLFAIAGFAGAAALFVQQEPIFESQSKLLVRYVVDTNTTEPLQAPPAGAPGPVGSAITTEVELITSVDVALDVAEKIGVEKLLPESAGHASLSDAASTILAELKVGFGQSVNVLHISYGDKNPELSKLVLSTLMECYFDKHLEIHRSAAAFDLVAKQTEEVHDRLRKTEAELNKLRTDSGIISLEDSQSALSSQRSRTNEDLMNAKAEFAEQKASIESLEKVAAVDELAAPMPDKDVKPKAAAPPQQVVMEFRAVIELLTFLQKRDFDLRIKYKTGNRMLTLNQQQIDTYSAKRRDLLAQYPALAEEADAVAQDPKNPRLNLVTEKAKLAAISAKIEMFESHLKALGQQVSEQIAIGAKIEELERRKQMEDKEYRTLEANLKEARTNLTLDPKRMPNITVLQKPTQPVKTYDAKMKKIIMGIAGAGLALGVGIAFLIELLFDRRVKRPIEIQTRLQLPLLLSIPFVRRKERGGFLLGNDQGVPRIGTGSEELAVGKPLSAELAEDTGPKKMGHFILPYSETIRDRIIFNFEVNNITHKPKLVAVTGLSEGAGASTIAAGLAKSFSEIPGMKVLLVDLSSFHPEDSPLFGEIPRHTLNGALHLARNTQFRQNPQNLYYASANARRDETGLTTFSPVHLYELMPTLQASEYDYIVFDMPPIDQTSRTLTMAGLMDKVLLVLDAENTSRDGLMWGYSELMKGRADVSCIFNKTREHAPGWLTGSN